MTYLDRHGAQGMIYPDYHPHISQENVIIFCFCLCKTENGLLQETPIENLFFEYQCSTNGGKSINLHGEGEGDFIAWYGARPLSIAY